MFFLVLACCMSMLAAQQESINSLEDVQQAIKSGTVVRDYATFKKICQYLQHTTLSDRDFSKIREVLLKRYCSFLGAQEYITESYIPHLAVAVGAGVLFSIMNCYFNPHLSKLSGMSIFCSIWASLFAYIEYEKISDFLRPGALEEYEERYQQITFLLLQSNLATHMQELALESSPEPTNPESTTSPVITPQSEQSQA